MPNPWLRALRRTPLITAIVAGAITFGGITAARVLDAGSSPPPLEIARLVDTAQANAPPPRALGLTAAYFRTLGIATREAVAEPVAVPAPAAECESPLSDRFAKQVTPPPSQPPLDSLQLLTARIPRELTGTPELGVPPMIAFPSE
jgi:hypothetical protein